MELANSRFIPASPQRTWNKLIAPETLKVCITGCERLERISDHEYLVGLHADVGPMSARCEGRLKLSALNPPHAYHLSFEGDGGVLGTARGEADITLAPEGDGTRLSYTAHVDLGGALAQMRPEQAEKIARKMGDNFFSLFSVCANRIFEASEAKPRRRPMFAPNPAVAAHRSEVFARYSWLMVAAVIAGIVAYHSLMH